MMQQSAIFANGSPVPFSFRVKLLVDGRLFLVWKRGEEVETEITVAGHRERRRQAYPDVEGSLEGT